MRTTKNNIYQNGFYLLLGLLIGIISMSFIKDGKTENKTEEKIELPNDSIINVDTLKLKNDSLKNKVKKKVNFVEGFKKDLAKIEVKPKSTLKKEVKVISQEIKTSFNPDSNYKKLSNESVLAELHKQGVQHPYIVLAQAKLETGNYSSKLCKNHNNIFGLRKGKGYRKYNTWQECITDYKTLIQSRYKGGDYYNFLLKIRYAEDPNYINKLKKRA